MSPLAGDQGEPGFDHVHPDAPLGVKVECDMRVFVQPCPHLRCGVSGQIVQHDVNVSACLRFHRLFQEGQELGVSRVGRQSPNTSPVPTVSAANRFVVPWRT